MALLFADYRKHAEKLIGAALRAAEPATAVKRHLRRDGRMLTVGDVNFDLDSGRVFLVSVGKAALPMSQAAVSVLGDDLAGGVVLTKKGARGGTFATQTPLLVLAGSHPVPDEASIEATTAVTEFIAQATVGDLIIFLISGGASALLTQPLLPLTDWQALTRALLASGCTIQELNCVRRQLDRVKGGGLARMAAPADCVTLILSDVVGNSLADIGSGPTVLMDESPADALAILRRYQVEGMLDTAVWSQIEQLLQQPDLFPTKRVQSQQMIVGDGRLAAEAVLAKATQLGFLAQILTTRLEGEARQVGGFVAAIAQDTPPGRCLILAGETTVTVRGNGQGGRNQELALAAALALRGCADTAVISVATDGEDGTTGAAGAVVSGETAVRAGKRELDPRRFLNENDSYSFFQQLDDKMQDEEPAHLIRTGPTGTNVNDLIIILTY